MTTRARAADAPPAEVSIVPACCCALQHLRPCINIFIVLLLLPAAQMLVFVASLCDMTAEQMEVAICSRMVCNRRPQHYARSIPVKGRHLGDIYSGKRFMRTVWADWATKFLAKPAAEQQSLIDVTAWRMMNVAAVARRYPWG